MLQKKMIYFQKKFNIIWKSGLLYWFGCSSSSYKRWQSLGRFILQCKLFKRTNGQSFTGDWRRWRDFRTFWHKSLAGYVQWVLFKKKKVLEEMLAFLNVLDIYCFFFFFFSHTMCSNLQILFSGSRIAAAGMWFCLSNICCLSMYFILFCNYYLLRFTYTRIGPLLLSTYLCPITTSIKLILQSFFKSSLEPFYFL